MHTESTIPESPASYVYFVQQVTGGPIKIGLAKDPKQRLYHIQLCNPNPLVLLTAIEGGRDLERGLHDRFAEHQVLGEWFEPVPDLIDLIAKYPAWNYRTTRSHTLSNNSAWKGVEASLMTKRQRLQRRFPVSTCAHCDRPAVDRRCVDGDYENPTPESILLLCRRCSMRFDGRLDQFMEVAHRPKFKTPPAPCSHCGREWKPLRKGLCRNCYEYRRRTGKDRPLLNL